MRDPIWVGDAVRFTVAGVANSLVTFLIYQVVLLVADPFISYVVAWSAGVAFIAAFYPGHVFPGGRTSAGDRLLLAAVYFVIFLIGLLVLRGAIALTGSPRVSIIVSMTITTAVSFFASRFILRRNRNT